MIRLACREDVVAIERIVERAYTHYQERLGRKPAPMTVDYHALVEEGVVWVMEGQGHVAGLAVFRQSSNHILVGNVAVDPIHQGQGFGRQLLGHAEDKARKLGLKELRLHTHELMHENIALYNRLGWIEYARAVQDDFPRVFMRKAI